MQLIPSMDLLQGRVVRLRHGNRNEVTFYPTGPEEWIAQLVAAGAQRIHLVDLDGAFGEARRADWVRFAKAHPEVQFQLGGGLRTRADVATAIDLGFDAVVGTLAIEAPDALAGLPPEKIIAALDMSGGALVVRGWAEKAKRSIHDAVANLRALGIGRALVTDVARDGAMNGPGHESIASVASLGMNVQASGGVRHVDDVIALRAVHGVVGAVCGRSLLDGAIDLRAPEVQALLRGDEWPQKG